jgi:methyl-accepting chemotaxis protein
VLDHWTISRKAAASFAILALLTVVACIAGVTSLRYVSASKDTVIQEDAARRLQVEEMRVQREQRAKAVRSYLITKRDKFIDQIAKHRDGLIEQSNALRDTSVNNEERRLIDAVIAVNAQMQASWDRVVNARRSGVALEDLVAEFDKDQWIVAALDKAMTDLEKWESSRMAQRSSEASAAATRAMAALVSTAILAAFLAAGLTIFLRRSIVGHVGDAVHHAQSSSTELRASAAQQASSSQELASTTAEISTTIRELLATSRQITESAQRVVQIAQETGGVARNGDATGQRANEAVAVIRNQVDVVVGHMLELGRRAQQIGAILDLINELAEQTNILSINATIEAAGAGESGRRFAVVADEIRRLADRVGSSAREIRTLIEEIRSAANTTVMATEDGRKSVDAGTRQFAEVITAFNDISQRVAVTTEAAREIELSIRQQSTAVEQVNVAVLGMAQAAKETEASAGQTLATAEQLAHVSHALGRLIWTKGAA